MAESAKRHDENSNLIKEIRASTNVAIRNQGASIKALEIQIRKIRKVLQERGSESLPCSTETNPRDHSTGYDDNEILKEFKNLQVSSNESATSLKRLLREKWRIEEEIKAKMNEHCSTIIKEDLPLKERDPGSFTLPCTINNMHFNKALADLGASVSVIPYSTFTDLGLGKLSTTKLIIDVTPLKSDKQRKGNRR
ncbi:reverse transcriptase domain-containing protein [Tanacetum coccineum]